MNSPFFSRSAALAAFLGAMGLSAIAQTTVTLTDTQVDSTSRDTTANNLTLTVNNADSATQSGVISGTGTLTKDGTGTLTLSAANTLTGDTNLTAGTIVLGNTSALATSTLVMSASTSLSFGSLTAATLGGLNTTSSALDITLENDSSAAVALTVNTNNSNYILQDYFGVLSGSGSLIKTGPWELRLKSPNTYTGGTTLAGGSIRMDDPGALGTTGTISFVGGELSLVSTDLSSRFSTAAGQAIKVGTFGSVTFASNLTSSGGSLELTAGTLTLTGNNTYSGGTIVTGGTLILGSSGALPATGNISFTGGTLALYDSTDLSSRFATTTGQSFKVDTNGNNVTFATLLSSASSSSFTKAGAGTLTLTAANSLWSGTTSVRGGTLLLGAANTLPSSRALQVNGDGISATLDLNNNNLSITTLSLGGTSTTSSATITTGSGTLTLGGNVTFSASSNPLGANIAGKVDLGAANRTFTIGNSTNAASDLTVSAVISGVGRAITKSGAGTLTLSGANTYTGATTVSAGTLNLTGSATGSAFTVGSTGTLTGTGTLGALTLNSGSFLSPGNSPGTLNAGNTTFAGGATYNWEVNDAAGVAGTNWDLLAITGTLNITATSGTPFNVALKSLTAGDAAGIVPNFNETQNATFVIATTTGGITGFAANAFAINTGGFANAFTGTWSVAANGNNLELNYAAAAIPEPSGMAALAGLAGLGLVLWRRRTAAGR